MFLFTVSNVILFQILVSSIIVCFYISVTNMLAKLVLNREDRKGAHGSIVVMTYDTSRKVAGSTSDPISDFSSIYLILPVALGHGVYSVFNRNEYHRQKFKCLWRVEHGRCVRLITSSLSMS
jgi:hypothetical protein